MDDLRELTKKIKENTTVKKEEKQNDTDIKNLFEHFFSGPSIGYLNAFLNKSEEKSGEQQTKRKSKVEIDKGIEKEKEKNENDVEEQNEKEKYAYKEREVEREHRKTEELFDKATTYGNKLKIKEKETDTETKLFSRDLALTNEKLKRETKGKKEKEVENLETHREEVKEKCQVDIRKILRHKKIVEINDFTKLIENFNEEIKRREKALDSFINENKSRNAYKDKFVMLENVATEMKQLEQHLQIKNSIYDLYFLKKKKKKTYDSLIFLKNFFSFLKNIIFFLEKAECCCRELKLLESLEHLKNCKVHITLVKYLLKYVRKKALLTKETSCDSKDGTETNNIKSDKKGKYVQTNNELRKNSNVSKNNNRYNNNVDNKNVKKKGEFFQMFDSTFIDMDEDNKILQDLKHMFYGTFNVKKSHEKSCFLKGVSIRYNNILNNLKKTSEIIFDKLFCFDANIKINRSVSLHPSDLIPGESGEAKEITYETFWNFVHQLKGHNTFLGKIKTHIFHQCCKLMILFYCFVKNINAERILSHFSNYSSLPYINCLTYKLVKNSVVDKIEKENELPITFEGRVNETYLKKEEYIYSLHTGKESTNINKGEQNKLSLNQMSLLLIDYIKEEENYLFINVELFYENIISFLNMSKGSKNQNINNSNNIICSSSSSSSSKNNNNNNNNNTNSCSSYGNLWNKKSDDLFFCLCRSLFDFCNFVEIIFSRNEKGKQNYNYHLDKNIYTEELIDAFSFYFEKNEVGKEDAMFFCKREQQYEEDPKLTNIIQKLKAKYESFQIHINKKMKQEELVASSRRKEVIPYYKLNQLSKSIFQFLHKINLKRKNMNNIEKVYFLYVWQQEQEKFGELIKYVMKKNFYWYLNYSYSILYNTFQGNNANEYVIINEHIDEYIFNSFLEKKIEDSDTTEEMYYEKIISHIEKQQSFLKNYLKEKKEKNISEKNYIEKHVLRKDINRMKKKNVPKEPTKGFSAPAINYEIFHQEGKKGNCLLTTKSDYIRGGENEQDLCKNEENVFSTLNESDMNIVMKYNNIGCIQIHKNILYVVCVIYQTFACAYKMLLEMENENMEKMENMKNMEKMENMKNMKNMEKMEKRKEEGEIELTAGTSIKMLKQNKNDNFLDEENATDNKSIEGMVYEIERKMPTEEEFVLGKKIEGEELKIETQIETTIEDREIYNYKKKIIKINTILLAYKIIKYIYNMFLSYTFCVFEFLYISPSKSYKEEHLITIINDTMFLKGVLVNMNELYLTHQNLFCVSVNEDDLLIGELDAHNNGTSFHVNDFTDKEYMQHIFTYEEKYGSHSGSSNQHELIRTIHEQKEKVNKIEKHEINETENIFLIDKISLLKKTYIFIDKFHINLDKYTKLFTKMYKERFTHLLKKEYILTDDFFLINTSKILSIIFDFFQIQILCASIHKQILLNMIDFFFFLINTHIYNFVYQKEKMTENEQLQLYEMFIFIQNSLFFILRHYTEDKTEDKNELPHEDNYFLKNFDDIFVNLANMKKNRILFLLLFCKIKYILNAKKSILDFVDYKDIEMYLTNNPHVCDDENFDAIVHEFS